MTLTLPDDFNWRFIFGFTGKIGFTISIFITFLDFDHDQFIKNAKLIISLSFLLAGLLGYFALKNTLDMEEVEESGLLNLEFRKNP